MSAQQYGHREIKDLIDDHLEKIPDFDAHVLQLSQFKVDMKRLVAEVDCIDTDGENINGSELFLKEGRLDEFRGCNERAIKCYEELKQLEVTAQLQTPNYGRRS